MENKIDIPVYPSSLFLFTGEDLPLCAFDESIIDIVNEAHEKNMVFGLEYVGDDRFKGMGTIVKLKSIVDRNKMGEMVVIVTGVNYFKINNDLIKQSKYRFSNVDVLQLTDTTYSFEIINMFKLYLKKQNNSNYNKVNSHLHLVEVMKSLNLPSSDKFRFFNAPIKEKEKFVFNHLRILTQIQHCEDNLHDGFTLN